VLGGFWIAFLIFVLNWPPVLTSGLYGLATMSYIVFYRRVIVPRFTAPVER
jgi:hypothetical protein